MVCPICKATDSTLVGLTPYDPDIVIYACRRCGLEYQYNVNSTEVVWQVQSK